MLVSSQCNRAAVSPPAPLLPVFAPLLAVPRCVPAKRPCRGNAPALGTAPEPDLCVYGNTERGMGQTLPACLITEFLPGIFALVIRHFPHFVNNMISVIRGITIINMGRIAGEVTDQKTQHHWCLPSSASAPGAWQKLLGEC